MTFKKKYWRAIKILSIGLGLCLSLMATAVAQNPISSKHRREIETCVEALRNEDRDQQLDSRLAKELLPLAALDSQKLIEHFVLNSDLEVIVVAMNKNKIKPNLPSGHYSKGGGSIQINHDPAEDFYLKKLKSFKAEGIFLGAHRAIDDSKKPRPLQDRPIIVIRDSLKRSELLHELAHFVLSPFDLNIAHFFDLAKAIKKEEEFMSADTDEIKAIKEKLEQSLRFIQLSSVQIFAKDREEMAIDSFLIRHRQELKISDEDSLRHLAYFDHHFRRLTAYALSAVDDINGIQIILQLLPRKYSKLMAELEEMKIFFKDMVAKAQVEKQLLRQDAALMN